MNMYICPPWYECDCEPGMPVSLSTMKRHMKAANEVRKLLGRGPFKRGPKVNRDMPIPYRFDQFERLEDHDTDAETDKSNPPLSIRREMRNIPGSRQTGVLGDGVDNQETPLANNADLIDDTRDSAIVHNHNSSGRVSTPRRLSQQSSLRPAGASFAHSHLSSQREAYTSAFVTHDTRGETRNAMNNDAYYSVQSRIYAHSMSIDSESEQSDEARSLSGLDDQGFISPEVGTNAIDVSAMQLSAPQQCSEVLSPIGGRLSRIEDGSDQEQNSDNEGEHDEIPESDQNVSRIPGFFDWLYENEKWVRLYQTHGLPMTVMDDILEIIEAPCKSWKTVIDVMAKVSRIKDPIQYYDTCPGHSCFATIRGSQKPPSCSVCGQSPSSTIERCITPVSYIPLLPRIAQIVGDESRCNQLYSYLHDSAFHGDILSDFFGSPAHKDLLSSAGGESQCRYDIFITVSTDGFQVFKNKRCDIWPLLTVLMNLSPTQRYAAKNVLPLMFISGRSEPKDLQSFLVPLVNELNSIHEDGGALLRFYDGTQRRVRIHLVWFTTDLAALKKIASITGVKGKTPCRFCLIQGYYIPSAKSYYFPSWLYQQDDRKKRKSLFDIRRLPLRTEESVNHTIESLMEAATQHERDHISRETGIQGESVLFKCSGVKGFTSFPIDVMHLFYNVQRLLLNLLLGSVEGLSLSADVVEVLDHEILSFSNGISGQVCTKPRQVSDWRNWKAAEHKIFTLAYCLILFDGHLPTELMNGLELFVELTDICFRYSVTTDDIERVTSLGVSFVEHYEAEYMLHKESRANFCTYVVHLLLHFTASAKSK